MPAQDEEQADRHEPSHVLGQHQRLSAVAGAVAISSVPPPVRPREIGEGVKFSLHWLVDLGWRERTPYIPLGSLL